MQVQSLIGSGRVDVVRWDGPSTVPGSRNNSTWQGVQQLQRVHQSKTSAHSDLAGGPAKGMAHPWLRCY